MGEISGRQCVYVCARTRVCVKWGRRRIGELEIGYEGRAGGEMGGITVNTSGGSPSAITININSALNSS